MRINKYKVALFTIGYVICSLLGTWWLSESYLIIGAYVGILVSIVALFLILGIFGDKIFFDAIPKEKIDEMMKMEFPLHR